MVGVSAILRWVKRLSGLVLSDVFGKPVASMKLRRGHVYPTMSGGAFFVVALVIVAFSINFSSKNGYVFGFAIASLLIASIPLAFANMANLEVRSIGCAPVHAGDQARFVFEVVNPSWFDRTSIGIRVAGRNGLLQCLDVQARSAKRVEISVHTSARGLINCPPLVFETRFPFGLFCVRVNWRPLAPCMVWPTLEVGSPTFLTCQAGYDGQSSAVVKGESEFIGVREFRRGDALRSIAWRQMAKENLFARGKLLTKLFDGSAVDSRSLSMDLVRDVGNFESKIMRLASWVYEAELGGAEYSLDIKSGYVEMGRGYRQMEQCMNLLALAKQEQAC